MMLDKRPILASYATGLLSAGRTVFTRQEALDALHISPRALVRAADRLTRKQFLLHPRRGFYVIVSPQHLSWGAPPPSWYIDDLMRHEGRPYYVGLLKAAELHGATHQAVMEFQVVTDKRIPKIRAGRAVISFHYRKNMEAVIADGGVMDWKTDTGSMKVSAPELTAFDLVRYQQSAGGLDAVATALADLAEKIVPKTLAHLASHTERSVIQRIGYLLDRLGHEDRTSPLHEHLMRSSLLPWVELEPNRHKDPDLISPPIERNERWHVVVRRQPEIDE